MVSPAHVSVSLVSLVSILSLHSKVPSMFNEGRRLVLTVYNVTIIAFLLIPVSFLFQEYLPSAIIQTIGISLNLVGTTSFLHLILRSEAVH